MNYWRLLSNTYLQKKQPISLIHMITRRCNARCRHCFIDFDGKPAEDELSTVEVEQLTRTFGDSLYSVYITGGEPFLRKDVYEIVAAYCRNTGAKSLNIATNGAYTQAVGDFLEKYQASGFGERLMVSISIDGLAEQHDANRKVSGLYRRAIETYRLIVSCNNSRIIPSVAITVTPYNCADVIETYRSLRDSGIDSFFPILMREQGVVKTIEDKPKVLAAHRELVRLIEADQSGGATIGTGTDLLGCYVNARNSVFNRVMPDIYLDSGRSFRCCAGTLFGVIFPDGNVCPCEVQERRVFGNLRDFDMDFGRLWSSEQARAVRGEMREQACACTFDGAWAINILSNQAFLPQLAAYFLRNLVLAQRRRS